RAGLPHHGRIAVGAHVGDAMPVALGRHGQGRWAARDADRGPAELDEPAREREADAIAVADDERAWHGSRARSGCVAEIAEHTHGRVMARAADDRARRMAAGAARVEPADGRGIRQPVSEAE